MIEAGRLGPGLWQLPETFVHYGSRGRGGNYSPAELATWARRIAQWRSRRDAYAYFNNDWSGDAPANAQTLAGRLPS